MCVILKVVRGVLPHGKFWILTKIKNVKSTLQKPDTNSYQLTLTRFVLTSIPPPPDDV